MAFDQICRRVGSGDECIHRPRVAPGTGLIDDIGAVAAVGARNGAGAKIKAGTAVLVFSRKR